MARREMSPEHAPLHRRDGTRGTVLRPAVLLLLFGSGLAAWSVPAHGGGIQLVERGTRALGRGGAALVAADEPVNGSYLNPATLTRQPGLGLQFETALIDYAVRFTRTPDPLSGDPSCCNTASSHIDYLNPGGGVSWSPAGGRWAAALTAFGPYAGATEFDRYSDARYLIVDQANALAYVQLSGAVRLPAGLSVGAGFQLRTFRMYQQLVCSVYPGFLGTPEDEQFDALLDVRVNDWFEPGFVAGLHWAVLPWLELGFSYQSGFDVEGTGTLKAEIPAHYLFADTEQEGDQLRLETRLPDIFRFGVRYVEAGRFDLELDLVWERWSQHTYITAIPEEPIRFTHVPGLGDYEMSAIALEDSFQDTYSLRLGGELHLLEDEVRLRMGLSIENGAVPDATLAPGALDADKLGLGIGAAWRRGGYELDIAYLHLFLLDREVTTSRRRQVNPLYPGGENVEGPTVVGNGSYSSRLDVLAVSALKRW